MEGIAFVYALYVNPPKSGSMSPIYEIEAFDKISICRLLEYLGEGKVFADGFSSMSYVRNQ